ncbi:hypothetical protein ZWY2020_049879 [Hordeum vulgare]|nr:hypothetical protein ZWY2020_049879 [Hordeum vulgare]
MVSGSAAGAATPVSRPALTEAMASRRRSLGWATSHPSAPRCPPRSSGTGWTPPTASLVPIIATEPHRFEGESSSCTLNAGFVGSYGRDRRRRVRKLVHPPLMQIISLSHPIRTLLPPRRLPSPLVPSHVTSEWQGRAPLAHYKRSTHRKRSYHDAPEYRCQFCGAVFWYRERCKQESNISERRVLYSLCCKGDALSSDKQIIIPLNNTTGEAIQKLILSTHSKDIQAIQRTESHGKNLTVNMEILLQIQGI